MVFSPIQVARNFMAYLCNCVVPASEGVGFALTDEEALHAQTAFAAEANAGL
jgi:hypothetical protein